MSVSVGLEFKSDELVAVLGQIRDRGKNLRGAMQFISDEMLAASQELIDTEGNGAWPELSDYTLERRRKNGRGAKMLQDTGRLAGSLDTDYSGEHAEVFTNVEYAKYHVKKIHGSSTDDRRLVPERDFLDIDVDAVERDAVDALTELIVGG